MQNTYLFIDFDSTFNQLEALDVLIERTLEGSERKEYVLNEVQRLTDLGMAGKIDYMESLSQRVNLLQANKTDISLLIEHLSKTITTSILDNQEFLVKHKKYIYIISNGFADVIKPIIQQFGLNEQQVFANEFIYDDNEHIIGINKQNPLSKSGGKPKVIKSLQLEGRIIMIGDGFNDYEVKKFGICDEFILFTENVTRKEVIPFADKIATSFNEIKAYLA